MAYLQQAQESGSVSAWASDVRRSLGVVIVLAVLLGGCASFDGRGLQPGQSTANDVERLMGAPADRRTVSGETWLYYPRQPFGRKMFVARMAADGRLAAVEQRLTDANIGKIVPQSTRGEDVRTLLGPPYNVTRFPRLEREVWEYHLLHLGDPGVPAALYVQFSPDGLAREVYLIDETSAPSTRD
jgi:hypothetical protein